MSQSTLIKEDLLKLSVKQLEKFATGVEGADLELVNEVIAEKRARLEQVKDDPNVAKEIGESIEAKELREKQLAEKAAAKEAADKAKAEAKEAADKAKAEAKAEAEKLKAEKLAESVKAKEELLALKAAKIAEKEAAKLSIAQQKEAAILKREEEKAAREEARKEALEALIEGRKQRAIESANRAAATAEKLAKMSFTPKGNKTQAVRDCLAKGMSNAQICEETGFTNKFVCDTVWRIEQMVAQNEFIEKRRAELAAQKVAEQ